MLTPIARSVMACWVNCWLQLSIASAPAANWAAAGAAVAWQTFASRASTCTILSASASCCSVAVTTACTKEGSQRGSMK